MTSPLRFRKAFRRTANVPGQKLPWRLRKANPGTPKNCRLLLGMAPKPALEELPIPSEIQPWVVPWLTQYQVDGICWALARNDANFWWACGSGKTVASIYYALCRGGPIVVVTNSNARRQFARAFEQFSSVKPTILTGQVPAPIPDDTRAVVINWEVLPHWRPALVAMLKRSHDSVFIVDEIHKAKNRVRTKKVVDPVERKTIYREVNNRSSSAAALGRAAGYRLGLTATPYPNTLADLWSQLDVLEPYCWGTSWDFSHQYCDAREGKYGGLDTDGRSHVEEFNQRLRTVCHIVTKASAQADLPPYRRQVSYISPVDQSRPPSIRAEMRAAAKRGSNAVLEVRIAEASARKRKWIALETLDHLEAGQKVCIFTGRHKDVENLAKDIGKKCEKLGATIWSAHGGSHSADERSRIAEEYGKHKGPCVLIGTSDSFGESIDGLQSTDLAIFAMLPWTPKQVEQAEGRFTRRGQDRAVLFLYPIAEGTVDEHVVEILGTKFEAVDETVAQLGVQSEAGEAADALYGHMTEEQLADSLLSRY